MKLLDDVMLYSSIKCEHFKDRVKTGIKEFFTGEDGVSNVVATVIILLIVIVLIAAFWNQLSEFFTGLMNKVFGTSLPGDVSSYGSGGGSTGGSTGGTS